MLRPLRRTPRADPCHPRAMTPRTSYDSSSDWRTPGVLLPRRAIIQQALGQFQTTEARDRFLLEASRIEVRAVLDKVDSLKTAAANAATSSELSNR
jgi:hypothetical protein